MPGGFNGPPVVPVASKPEPGPPALPPKLGEKSATPEPTLVNEPVAGEKGLRPRSSIMHSIKDLGRKLTRNETGGGALIPGASSGSQSGQPSGHVTPLTNISACGDLAL